MSFTIQKKMLHMEALVENSIDAILDLSVAIQNV